MDEQRLKLLLDRYFDQILSVEERKELELMLLAFPRAREMFWEGARLNALIRNWGEAEWGRDEALHRRLLAVAPPPAGFKSRFTLWLENFRGHLLRWILPAGVTALVILGGFWGYQKYFGEQENHFPQKGIAMITRMTEAAWDNNREPIQPDSSLQPGWLRLDHGAIEIEFSRGARVILEAPAELQLISANEAFLRSGKLNAHVPPPARGFTIKAANFSVVDHGTDFGCIIGETNSEVHVFTGKVSWQPSVATISERELKKNQAIRYANETVQSIPADRAEFLSEAELARLDASRESLRLAEWRKASLELQHNPATIAYFNFKPSSSDATVMPNLAVNAPANSDATIIGCETAEGRWPDKSALEFKSHVDHVRLAIPGQFKVLTFLAWIRVDGLTKSQQALAMCESFQPGELHWYLHHDGTLSLGELINTNNPPHGWRDFRSQPIFNEDNLGTWAMVATVCDSTTGEIRHYFNGEPVGVNVATAPSSRLPMRLDTFEIGNWGVTYNDPKFSFVKWNNPRDAVRNFHGRIDEFAILATALSPQEIQKIYREGSPSEPMMAKARR